MSILQAIDSLKTEMAQERIQPENGLGEELFLFTSTLMPVINVDILVTNQRGELLLAWRDDPHCGKGWHIPGGCVRFQETILEQAHKTALREFGHSVLLDPEVLHVFEIFSREERPIKDQNERAHFITVVISGYMPADFDIEKQTAEPGQPGYMKWFSELPDDLLQVQNCYRKQWPAIRSKLKGKFGDGIFETCKAPGRQRQETDEEPVCGRA